MKKTINIVITILLVIVSFSCKNGKNTHSKTSEVRNTTIDGGVSISFSNNLDRVSSLFYHKFKK